MKNKIDLLKDLTLNESERKKEEWWERRKNQSTVIEKVNKLTYPQDWTSYNNAKTKEKSISMSLLLELIEFLDDKEKNKIGRPTFSLQEKLICMFVYAYSQFSSRRAISDIELAKKLKLLSKTPHFNSVLNMFKDNKMSRILLELVEISSLPLRQFEEHLSVDGSGFSCSQFERWIDIRTQQPKKLRSWMKANIICGALTNTIASITITEGHAADSPQLIPLVKRATKYFEPKEISADKAYISRANLQAISSAGAIPYIPFKKNARQNPRGCKIWTSMFTYFHNNREEFLSHYHNRSNVETTFSMIKRNFGSKLRTKNFNSQINEILMKCLCHNLSVLVQESFEMGLEIDLSSCANLYNAQKEVV